jgi:hypothetical protein
LAVFQQIIVQQPARGYAGIVYRVAKKLFNDTLELELSGLGLTANQGWLMRPRIRYQVNDDLSLALAAIIMQATATLFSAGCATIAQCLWK